MLIFLGNPKVLRGFFYLFGLTLVFLGITAYSHGEPGHRNYWGALVLAGTSIVIGLLFIVVACLPKGVLPALPGQSRREKRSARQMKPKRKK